MVRKCILRFVDAVVSDHATNDMKVCKQAKSIHRAALFKGGKIMSYGYNQARNVWGGKVIGCSCHAEVNAIKNLIKVAKVH